VQREKNSKDGYEEHGNAAARIDVRGDTGGEGARPKKGPLRETQTRGKKKSVEAELVGIQSDDGDIVRGIGQMGTKRTTAR